MVNLNEPPELINIGATPDSPESDTIRAGGAKINEWFAYLLQAWFENSSILVFGEGAPKDWDGLDPDTSTGADGGYYMDVRNFLLYGPRVSGVWPDGVSFQGPPGVATNGMPVGGDQGQAIIKSTSQDFAVAWGNIVRCAGDALTVQAAAIADGSVLVKGSGNALNALGWLAFQTTSTLQSGDDGAMMVKVNGKFAEQIVNIFHLDGVERQPDSSLEQIGDVLTIQPDGKLRFGTPLPKVFEHHRGLGYEFVQAAPWDTVKFTSALDPTRPVEMMDDGIMRCHVDAHVNITCNLTLRSSPIAPVTAHAQVEVVLESMKPGDQMWNVVPGSLRHLPFEAATDYQSHDFMWPHIIVDTECLRIRIRGDAETTDKMQVVGPSTSVFIGS